MKRKMLLTALVLASSLLAGCTRADEAVVDKIGVSVENINVNNYFVKGVVFMMMIPRKRNEFDLFRDFLALPEKEHSKTKVKK